MYRIYHSKGEMTNAAWLHAPSPIRQDGDLVYRPSGNLSSFRDPLMGLVRVAAQFCLRTGNRP